MGRGRPPGGQSGYLRTHLPRARLATLPGADELWFTGDTGALLDELEAFVADLPHLGAGA